MHIVLAFILSIFSAVLVVLNYNQYNELSEIESRRSVAMQVSYPQFKRSSGPVQVTVDPVYKEIKPYKPSSRNSGSTVQQPGFLSGNFSAGSIVRQSTVINSGQNESLQDFSMKPGRIDRNFSNTFVGQYGMGGVNMISHNGSVVQNQNVFRNSQLNQRNQDRPQSELIARGQSSFSSNMFGATEAGPSFAKSDLMSTPLGIDPGGDPDDPLGPPTPMIPVPDGLAFLIFISLFYSLFVFLRKRS